MTSQEAQKATTLMTAISSEHRLRILTELLYGGRYASELEAVLKDISPSTISNHLKIRGIGARSLREIAADTWITLPGRIALKTATRLARLLDRRRS